jgi:hypothetical protein
MYSAAQSVFTAAVLMACAVGAEPLSAPPRIDLVELLAGGKLRAANRDVTILPGDRNAVRVDGKLGAGPVWIAGSDFSDGVIAVDVRGRDVFPRSLVGIAFHREDDKTYDAVYLRPFNFRAADSVRRHHAVQYVSFPDFDWPRLRVLYPEEFENPVDPSIEPTDWVPLRILVSGPVIRVYVGPATSPTLEVRKLGQFDRGMIGLWTGANSDGDFANLRITPKK